MNNVDLGRYSKRIVKYLWDPEPNAGEDQAFPIWCLGRRYDLRSTHKEESTEERAVSPLKEIDSSPVKVSKPEPEPESDSAAVEHTVPTKGNPDADTDADVDASFEEVKGSEAPSGSLENEKASWPEAFIDDFESRIWLTYRSGFPPIPKSRDPKASSAMSLSVRLKSQLTSQAGFTTDTGWGCMIRSGQCLVANALALLRLGRGMAQHLCPRRCGHAYTPAKIGSARLRMPVKRRYCSSSQTIRVHPSPSTTSSSTALPPAVRFQASGLALLQLPSA